MSERDKSFVSASQIRAARGLLNWSQDDLAAACKLSVATIRKLELGHISPRVATTETIRQALEDAGLEFVEPNGVRQRPEDITVYRGREGAKEFYDDVYHTASRRGCDVFLVCPSASAYLFEVLGDYRGVHIARMEAIKKDKKFAKCILIEDLAKGMGPLWADAYCEYRQISKNYINSVPFYVYDDKYAIIVPETELLPKITVIQSRLVAEAFRQQFYSMWEKATVLGGERKMPVSKPEPNQI